MDALISLLFIILIIYLFLKVLEDLRKYRKEEEINKKNFDKVMKQNKIIAQQNLSLLKRVASLEKFIRENKNVK